MLGNKRYYLQCATRLALFFAAVFVICFGWYWVPTGEKELHEALFRLTFLGWSGMNSGSFLLGLAQSFIWGYVFVALWYAMGCCKKTGCCYPDQQKMRK